MKTNNYLTTNEFTKRVEEFGFDVVISETTIFIYNNDHLIATVLTCKSYQLYTNYSVWETLSEHLQKSLFKLLTDYASTPPDEREEEKKFYLEHKWMGYEGHNYLTQCNVTGKHYLSFKIENKHYKTQFTQEEINKIKEKYNTDLSDFEEIEVKE